MNHNLSNKFDFKHCVVCNKEYYVRKKNVPYHSYRIFFPRPRTSKTCSRKCGNAYTRNKEMYI